MAETLSILSIVSFAVAVVCLVLAIFLWFFFKIPTVIGDLTGRTARKSIAKMRTANEKSGAKAYRESTTNVGRGKLTGSMSVSAKSRKKENGEDTQNPETGLLADNKEEVFDSEATGLLNVEATGLLDSEATGLLLDEGETAPLVSSTQHIHKRTGGKKLVMLEEVILVHTDEVIKIE